MNIILFGPPGVGKSTLIGILKSKGFRAIDLEDVYPNSLRFQIPSLVRDTFLGAADLNPARKYNNALKVLLYADQATYDQRRNYRDSQVVGKSKQAHHMINDWLKGVKYDLVLDTSKLSPARTSQRLAKLMKEGISNGKKETKS